MKAVEVESGVFLIDKDLEWSSFQAVNKIRFLFKYRKQLKLKVGHAGTLDPLATGLLIVCYGKMTKEISKFQDMPKEYIGEIKLGATRPSHDMETEVDGEFPVDHITEDKIRAAAAKLMGRQLQQPPEYSAKRINGKRAYELARKGLVANPKKHEIEVFEFSTKFKKPDVVEFKIRCSKGTYVRTLAYDLGKLLDSGGHLTSLRRTAIGDFSVDNALRIAELEAQFDSISK